MPIEKSILLYNKQIYNGFNNKNKTRSKIWPTKGKTAVEKKRNKGERREQENESHFMCDTCTFSPGPDLHVIHSILFFHLILFYFSLSSPSVIFLRFFSMFGVFVVGDERRFCHRPSAHWANHQYTHYECVCTLYIDRFDWGSILCSSVSWHKPNILPHSLCLIGSVYWPRSFVRSQIHTEKRIKQK